MALAIVPAAGRSRRMGRPKLLLPFGGRSIGAGGSAAGTVIGATLAALAAGGARRIAVVARPGDRRLRLWLRDEAAAEIERRLGRGRPEEPPACEIVPALNPAPERGMLSSVVAGLVALGLPEAGRTGEAQGLLLVCPGDLPALAPDTVAAVLEALAPGPAAGRPGAVLAVPVHAGRRGHPLAIAPGLVAGIPDLDPGVGLRQLLDRHPDEVAEVPVDDPGCVRDLDTPEDYRDLVPPAAPHGRT